MKYIIIFAVFIAAAYACEHGYSCSADVEALRVKCDERIVQLAASWVKNPMSKYEYYPVVKCPLLYGDCYGRIERHVRHSLSANFAASFMLSSLKYEHLYGIFKRLHISEDTARDFIPLLKPIAGGMAFYIALDYMLSDDVTYYTCDLD